MTGAGAPTLISIRALARAGAIELAWRLFEEAGLGSIEDDDAVLALRGRLLKDRALALEGSARRSAALAAAAAYRSAASIRVATYPLINAATLSLLGGDREAAETSAREVLALLDAGGGELDTPYYLAATRAEALLLLGSPEAAAAALAEAIAKAPLAWEDHASTLRQFAVILDALGLDRSWLDAYRPPRAMHFAGQMGLDDEAHVAAIDAVLDDENVGFGFGSLAAGADILVAERLLARKAELHVVLPEERGAFVGRSVAPYGAEWSRRFEAVLARATSVREVLEGVEAADLAIELADEIAMGQAAMHAHTLESEPIQLLIGPLRKGSPAGHNSARVAEIWASAGRRRHLLESAAGGSIREAPQPPPAGFRLAAIVAVSLTDQLTVEPVGDLVRRIALVPALTGLIAAPQWRGDGLTLGFASPTEAASAALAIRSALAATGPVRVGGHFGLVGVAADPLGGEPLLLGEAAGLAQFIVNATPSTAVYVSEQFAAALAARDRSASMPEFVGELGPCLKIGAVALYALKPRPTKSG
jgi:hypothetical protein